VLWRCLPNCIYWCFYYSLCLILRCYKCSRFTLCLWYFVSRCPLGCLCRLPLSFPYIS
jgi:hypothetical protein